MLILECAREHLFLVRLWLAATPSIQWQEVTDAGDMRLNVVTFQVNGSTAQQRRYAERRWQATWSTE